MTGNREITYSRRQFVRLAASAAACGPLLLSPRGASGREKTLKIARWSHFLPEHDRWLVDVYAKEWGKQHDTTVEIDLISTDQIHARASAETAAGKGHDLFMFPWPPAEFQPYAIDHTEVYQTVGARHGTVNRIGHKSTFDPKTKKYFAFADSWMPAPICYLGDYWTAVGAPAGPIHYNDLRVIGRHIREKMGVPCGLALGPGLEGNVTLHTLLYAFGGQVFDADGNVNIRKNYGTITALKYVKALYDDAGTPEQLTWGPSGNARAMQARKTSCTMSDISLLRGVEQDHPDIAKNILVRPPLLGSAGIMATPYVTSCSVVWNFAENKEGAKQFLSDFIDNFRTAYEKSGGCSFPTYQNTVPNLIRRLEDDPKADPPYKYTRLKDALHWTPNLGFPGFATPAAMEAFNSSVLPRMFISVVKGQLSAEDAAGAAEVEVKRIAEKWKQVSQSAGKKG